MFVVHGERSGRVDAVRSASGGARSDEERDLAFHARQRPRDRASARTHPRRGTTLPCDRRAERAGRIKRAASAWAPRRGARASALAPQPVRSGARAVRGSSARPRASASTRCRARALAWRPGSDRGRRPECSAWSSTEVGGARAEASRTRVPQARRAPPRRAPRTQRGARAPCAANSRCFRRGTARAARGQCAGRTRRKLAGGA